ncbi:MAG: hypothetical protein KAV48_07330 [Methanomicrobia archaeon]|nr:hypothetical protein [Methanomicrobia archaeon]
MVGGMRTIYREENAPFPEIEFTDTHFYITFKQSREYLKMAKKEEVKEKVEIALNKRQKIALEYAKKYGKITNREYRNLFPRITDKTVYRDLQDMVKKGLIKPIGIKKGRYYEPR